MVNLQSSVTAPSAMEPADAAEPSAVKPNPLQTQIDGHAIHQTILKLTTPLAKPSTLPPADRSVTAMQRLIDVIQELRSPGSGWSADIPQTPETIAPYVAEEATDFLETLALDSGSLAMQGDRRWQGYFPMQELNTWLLWCISRSAYEVMGLLEGTAATVELAEEGWRSGFLRLAAILEVETPESSWTLDLVTNQPPPSLLPSNTQIHTPDSRICRQPTLTSTLLTTLIDQIQMTTPELCPFLEGVGIDVLVPRRHWQFGIIKVWLGLEFIAHPEGLPSCYTHADDKDEVQGQPSIAFTDPTWKERYETAIAHQHLRMLLSQRSYLDCSMTESSIALLVQEACDLAETLQTSLSFSSRNFTQKGVALSALAPRLLWCLSRSDQAVMQLMGGIRARLLQPEQDWASGTLRLLVSLTVQTPELDWYLDLATGQPPHPSLFPLLSEAIVQSEESQWCQSPHLAQALNDRVMSHIRQATPEIQLLIEGTAIDLLSTEGAIQSGTIRLNAALEFIPDHAFHLTVS